MSGIFDSIGSFFYSFFNQIIGVLKNVQIFDFVDVLIVAYIIYKAIGMFKDSRAKVLTKGIVVLVAGWIFARWLGMETLEWMLGVIVNSGLIIIAIVFQPELRRLLERLGHSSLGVLGSSTNAVDARTKMSECIDEIVSSVGMMSDKKTGALIVFERMTPLGEVANTGTIIDAAASQEMVSNIFFPKSPLHDGALIVKDARLYSAGCILPLTSNAEISTELGTRHRAAIGMSENSDAVVIVVSEETGTISVAISGNLRRDYTPKALKKKLDAMLLPDEENSSVRVRIVDSFKSFFKKEEQK